MRTRDEARRWDEFERSLDEGMVEDREVTLRLPSLDLDVLGITVRTFTASIKTYLEDVEAMEEDVVDALPPDGPLLAPETGDTADGDNAPREDMPPSHR